MTRQPPLVTPGLALLTTALVSLAAGFVAGWECRKYRRETAGMTYGGRR